MSSSALRVALLIVSTTAAKDPSTDASESILRDVIEQEGGGKWEVVDTKIVPDVVVQIQRQLMLWADVAAEDINLILTTGGTGFAVSDCTPEVRIIQIKVICSVPTSTDLLAGCLGSAT